MTEDLGNLGAISEAYDRIIAIEQQLAGNAAVVEVRVDGQSVKYDREQAMQELLFWRRRLSRLRGVRPVAGQIRLGGMW